MPGILFRNGKVLYDARTGKILYGDQDDACCCENACQPGCFITFGGGRRGFVQWNYGQYGTIWDWTPLGVWNGSVVTRLNTYQSRQYIVYNNHLLGNIKVRVNHPTVVCPDELPFRPSINFHLDAAAGYADLFTPPNSVAFGTTPVPLKLIFNSRDGVANASTLTINDYGFNDVSYNLVSKTNFTTISWRVEFIMRYSANTPFANDILVGEAGGSIPMIGCGGYTGID